MVPPVLELISTDFDGTLHADCEDPPVPLDLQELLAEFQARGAKWVINTGRDLPSVMEGMARARMRVRPDYVVTVEREIFVHEDSQYVPCVEWNRRCTSAHASLFERIAPDVPRLMKWVGERFRATLYEDAFSPFCLIAENAASADEIQVYLE